MSTRTLQEKLVEAVGNVSFVDTMEDEKEIILDGVFTLTELKTAVAIIERHNEEKQHAALQS